MTPSEKLIEACRLMDKRFEIGERALKEHRRLSAGELQELENLSDEMKNLKNKEIEQDGK